MKEPKMELEMLVSDKSSIINAKNIDDVLSNLESNQWYKRPSVTSLRSAPRFHQRIRFLLTRLCTGLLKFSDIELSIRLTPGRGYAISVFNNIDMFWPRIGIWLDTSGYRKFKPGVHPELVVARTPDMSEFDFTKEHNLIQAIPLAEVNDDAWLGSQDGEFDGLACSKAAEVAVENIKSYLQTELTKLENEFNSLRTKLQSSFKPINLHSFHYGN